VENIICKRGLASQKRFCKLGALQKDFDELECDSQHKFTIFSTALQHFYERNTFCSASFYANR
jgi:hypothetical protein